MWFGYIKNLTQKPRGHGRNVLKLVVVNQLNKLNMRTFSILLFSLSLSSVYCQNNSDSIISKITEKIDSMPDGFAVSIALIKNNQVAYYGFIKENRRLKQIELKDSLFEIGSITKVFTSTILANEIVNGNIKLNDLVNKSFPLKFNNKIKISYGSLANHTSGLYRLPSNIMPLLLKNQQNPYSEYSFEMFDNYLKNELQLDQRDSAFYAYSNLGAGLLAYSLSNKTKIPFDNLLKTNIFDKYKMNSTFYLAKTSFSGLNPDGTKAENWQFNAMMGAGGLISTTSDLSKFVQAQFDSENKELALTQQPTFQISKNMSIGLAWHIIHPETNDAKYWHNGGTGGFTSSLSFRTTNNTGVVILSNISAASQQSSKIDELCFELLDFLK